jgi:hypothetical protein
VNNPALPAIPIAITLLAMGSLPADKYRADLHHREVVVAMESCKNREMWVQVVPNKKTSWDVVIMYRLSDRHPKPCQLIVLESDLLGSSGHRHQTATTWAAKYRLKVRNPEEGETYAD